MYLPAAPCLRLPVRVRTQTGASHRQATAQVDAEAGLNYFDTGFLMVVISTQEKKCLTFSWSEDQTYEEEMTLSHSAREPLFLLTINRRLIRVL